VLSTRRYASPWRSRKSRSRLSEDRDQDPLHQSIYRRDPDRAQDIVGVQLASALDHCFHRLRVAELYRVSSGCAEVTC
jgi:hypothetical protein